MKIQKCTIEFYEEVVKLWRDAGISVGSSDTKEEVTTMLNLNPDLCLVGQLNDKVIAVVMGGFDGRRGYVHHLAVATNYQTRGYGRKLIDRLMETFRKMGVHKVHLFIEKNNKNVINFYSRLGWELRDDLIMMSFVPDKNIYKRNI